jgi:hypothetical protein
MLTVRASCRLQGVEVVEFIKVGRQGHCHFMRENAGGTIGIKMIIFNNRRYQNDKLSF